MNCSTILGLILDIGIELIKSGAETHRVEDSLYRLCSAYKFERCSVWVVPSNIQATVTSPEGEVFTQIRHVWNTGVDFDRLDRLNDFCRRACRETPEADELAARFKEARHSGSSVKKWLRFPAALLAGVGFSVFFNCSLTDAITAAAASLLIALMGMYLGRRENNPLVYNFVISFAAEMLILFMVHMGIGQSTGSITVGVVMLLISALGATNGVRDLVHLDTLSGLMNITASITGALGIALGIALPLVILPSWGSNDMMGLNPSPVVTLISAAVGCLGFAMFFNVVKPRHLLFCAVGAAIVWAVYLLLAPLFPSAFLPTLLGSAVCAVYAIIMSRLNKAPATIFQTICIFPLIPGSALYYTAYGAVSGDVALAKSMGSTLLMTCFAIVLGFIAVEAVNRLILHRQG